MFSMLSIGYWRPPASREHFSNAPRPEPVVLRIADRSRARFRHRALGSGGPAWLEIQVENLLEHDSAHQRHLRVVRKRQRALRGRVSHVGWRAYLDLEEAEFVRWAHSLERVMRWAFLRGRREGGRRRRENR